MQTQDFEISWRGKYVRLCKVGPELGRTVHGQLGNDLEVEHRVVLFYTEYGTERTDGILRTSPIKKLTPVANGSMRVETENSVYLISQDADVKELMTKGESVWNPL